MADRTIKPDDTNDLVLQNNHGGAKIGINEGDDITITLGGSSGDDLNIDSNTLVVESDTNRVGIGTAAPSELLELSGTGADIYAKVTAPANYNSGIRFFGDRDWTFVNDGRAVYGTADYFHIYDTTASLTRLAIDTSGNIGIGTTSPGDYNSVADNLVIAGTSTGEGVTIFSGTDKSGNIFFARGTGTDAYKGYIQYTHGDDFLHIGTAGVTRVQIRDNGNFDIGGASHAARRLSIKTTVTNNTENAIEVIDTTPSTIFKIQADGDYYHSGSAISDKDLKENIIDVIDGSLEKIKLLKPKSYNFKESEGFPTNKKHGFIAQEVAEVFGTNDGIATGTDGKKNMAVCYNGVLTHLVKAFQELSAKVTALENA